ncbi:hypothetical protein BD779DRAFT_1483656 [Infundibulicybe gibba]|nr:hypothetical protein BD779DRAFT_1483656 [Infundibulicybe gibba]
MSSVISQTDASVSATPMQQLVSVSRTVLQQGVDLLDYLSSDDQLSKDSQFLPGSTIGKHLRHARDHFRLLAECISSPPPYILSYDRRTRNAAMETNRASAREALLATIQQLEDLVPNVDMDEQMTLNAVTPHMQVFETTFGRELWFAALHCIHHWSMVRVVAGELKIKLSDDFGFAPSTLLYQGREAPLGKTKM